MSAPVDLLAVTREMRERQVARHFKSDTLIAWAARIEAAISERDAAVAELIEAAKFARTTGNGPIGYTPGADRRLAAALARLGATE